MTLSISDAIMAESFFEVVVGTGGDISSENATLMQSYVSEDVTNFIGDRAITGDLRTRIEACFILDYFVNKHGKGTIVSQTIIDVSWKSQIKTTSQYMDRAYTLRENVSENTNDEDYSGIYRHDTFLDYPRGNVHHIP